MRTIFGEYPSEMEELVIEMIVARGWQIWVNGEKPRKGWVIGEGGRVGHWVSDLVPDLHPLDFGGGALAISRLRLLREDDEEITWDDWGDNVPAKLYVNDGSDGFWLPITFIVFGSSEGELHPRVTTLDGRTHEIDEIMFYIRAEVKS